jgi:hypothetical protein
MTLTDASTDRLPEAQAAMTSATIHTARSDVADTGDLTFARDAASRVAIDVGMCNRMRTGTHLTRTSS